MIAVILSRVGYWAATAADRLLETLWPTPQSPAAEPQPVTTLDDVVSQLAQLTYLVEDIRNLLATSPLGEHGPAVAAPPDAAAGPLNTIRQADQRIATRLSGLQFQPDK